MEFKKIAEQVLEKIGGAENVEVAQHCITRLRLVLKDETLADDEAVKKIDGVAGVVKSGGQYQVIIGPSVKKVFTEFETLISAKPVETAPKENGEKKKQKGIKGTLNTFFKTITGIFFPVITLMAASGLIKGILVLFTVSGLLTETDGTYLILYGAADTLFYFFPVILGFSAGKKFGGNPYLCAVIGAALVYPGITDALSAEGANLTFFKIPVVSMTYSNSVFPIMAAAWFASQLEKTLKKIVPDVITFVADALILVVTIPLSYLIIGPVFTTVSNVLATSVNGLYAFSPIITGIILGAFWQVFVMVGLHYAFIPIFIAMLMENGYDPLNPILAVSVFALAGAMFGFALKVTDKKAKALGLSTGASALLGTTEPALYSVAIPYRKPFIASFFGGGIAGVIVAVIGGRQFGISTGGILGFGAHIDPSGNPRTLISYFVSVAVAIVVTAIITYIITDKNEVPKA